MTISHFLKNYDTINHYEVKWTIIRHFNNPTTLLIISIIVYNHTNLLLISYEVKLITFTVRVVVNNLVTL